MKAYLVQSDYSDLATGRGLLDFKDALAFADAEIAEEVFVRVCKGPVLKKPSNSGIEIGNIRPEFKSYFTKARDMAPALLDAISAHFDEGSISVLEGELDTENPVLCAYLVSTLTRLGYDWPQERLREMLKHRDWRVRLSVLFAAETELVESALNDESSLIRVIAQSVLQGRAEGG